MNQLQTLTGRDRRTIAQRISDAGVAPLETTARERWYPARPALEAIYGRAEDLDPSQETARLRKEQADAQALKNAEARGEYVRGEDVDTFLMRLVGAVVQRIRAVAPKAAPEVRATASDAEGEALLARFHDEALTEIADAGRRVADRLARGRSVEVGGELRGARADSTAAATADGERVGGRRAEAEPGVERGAGAVEDGEG